MTSTTLQQTHRQRRRAAVDAVLGDDPRVRETYRTLRNDSRAARRRGQNVDRSHLDEAITAAALEADD